MTAQSLADELAVSVRTIYRYVDDLSVSGIPIYGEPGIGYQLREGFELPPLMLTPDELDALLLGTQMVSVSTGSRLAAGARTLLSKIAVSLPGKATHELNRWAYALTVDDRRALSVLWDTLQKAICSRYAVRFCYVTQSGESSYREVCPLGLFYWGGKWTLGSWCLLRDAFRDFRLDRMRDVEVLPDKFALTDELSLNAYMSYQAAAWDEVRSSTDSTVSVGDL